MYAPNIIVSDDPRPGGQDPVVSSIHQRVHISAPNFLSRMMSKIAGDFSGQRQLGLSIRGSNPFNLVLFVLSPTSTTFHPVIFPPPTSRRTHRRTKQHHRLCPLSVPSVLSPTITTITVMWVLCRSRLESETYTRGTRGIHTNSDVDLE